MQDKTLIKIALLCTLIGIIVLFAIPSEQSILPDMIRLRGTIDHISNYGNTTKISIGHYQITDVILFDNNKEFEKGQLLEVVGRQSQKEIIGEEVRLIKPK